MRRYAPVLFVWSILPLTTTSIADSTDALGPYRPEGFGAKSIGGQGGQVLFVTSLADTGKGTLREALATLGPRIIRFQVGGEIRLASPLIVEKNGRVTIDGRSALRRGGITLRSYGVDFRKCDDVIVTNIRQRRAKFGMGSDGGCFGIVQCKRVLFDHCSGAWSSDENFGAFRVEDVTFQWCISAEGLSRSGHIEGAGHSCGIIVHRAHGVTLHHSLFVNNVHRNPFWKGNYGFPWGGATPPADLATGLDKNGKRVFGHFDIRNNLFYNYGRQAGLTHFASRTNFQGNVYRPGPSSPAEQKAVAVGDAHEQFGFAKIFAKDNLGPNRAIDDEDQYALFSGPVADIRVLRPFDAPPVRTQPPGDAMELVLRHAGAWPRDDLDARFVREVKEGKGQAGGGEDVQAPLLRFVEPNQRHVYPFLMDNGPGGEKYSGTLRFRVLDAPADLALAIDLNGVALPSDHVSRTPAEYVKKTGYWCEISLDACPPFKGKNELGIRVTGQFESTQAPLVDELEIEIASATTDPATDREVLYNGIRLTTPWPPFRDALPLDPPPDPPYLVSPPAVIPIDVGRQLLVDDFLIEHTDLKRVHHTAELHPENPVLKPDRPWEQKSFRGDDFASAMTFGDGVWYDPKDELFKAWYMGGFCLGTSLATSKDGVHWDKPLFDIEPGTNVVHPQNIDCTGVWLDLEEQDPKRRYKMIRFPTPKHPQLKWLMSLHFSADGIHWGPPAVVRPVLTRTSFFYNPFRKVWVFSIRHGIRGMEALYDAGAWRSRTYWEAADFISAALWPPEGPGLWVGADRLDAVRGEFKVPQLYNVDAVAYESIMLGLFTVLRGTTPGTNRPKINDVVVGYSRDGWHWTRPDRRPFIPVSERGGDWNWGNVQSTIGCCLVVGDKLYFYASGRTDTPGNFDQRAHKCSTGLAVLRRDGFASMDAGENVGQLTTRPVRFKGKHLFVNVDADEGELRAEVLDKAGNVLAPFTRGNSVAVSADTTLNAVTWNGAEDLSALAGEEVRFRFSLRNGSLYAFWVSPDASGASHGYVAAGGPGFTGPIDTVGDLEGEAPSEPGR